MNDPKKKFLNQAFYNILTIFHENRGWGVLRYLAPKMATLKLPKKIRHPVHPKKIFVFAIFKKSSDRRDLYLYFDMKKNNCRMIIDGTRAFGKL